MQNQPFIVTCERMGRKAKYRVFFFPNNQLIDRFKNLPNEQRVWNANDVCWEVTTKGLYEIIKIYKRSNKILFDFDNREAFIKQIKKIDTDEKEKEELLAQLEVNKKHWLKYKEELDEKFEEYSDQVHENLKDGIKLYPHQISGTMFLNAVRNGLLSHEMGLGKAQDIDSKLLTTNGWVRMGDIKLGDYVIGSNGKPTKVLGVFPQGEKDIYELKFNDGTRARSCDEHLWNVNTYIRNWRKNPFLIKTLREIMDNGLQFKNGNNKWYIPIVKPVEFEEKKLKIDPYVLGCLLGDGGLTRKGSISFSSIDEELVKNINQRLPKNHILNKKKNTKIDYYLISKNQHNNYVNQDLRKYNLKEKSSYTKFIPHDYLFGSINQRLEILQGVLDTDGHSRKDSIVELTLASKKLIKDVQFIVQSLGGIGRLKPKYVIYKGEKRKYYRLHIKLPPQFIPFKLQRKIDTFVAPTKYLPNRAIKEINFIGKKEAQCILVDADDHLYVTDNCVVTHNTLVSIAYAEMNHFKRVLVITPNSLKFNYYDEVEKFSSSKAHIINWKKNKYTLEEAKYIIVNYEYFNPKDSKAMDKKFKALGIGEIDCLVCDESHRLKNAKSNTYKNFKRIFKKTIFRNDKISKIFLSGTPTPNRANELYTILNQISPLDFPTKQYFYEHYLGMMYDPAAYGGWIKSPTPALLTELYHKIAPFTHRKKKKEVLTDLPDKIYQKVVNELSSVDQPIYNDIEEGIANEFINENIDNPLTIMLRLRQFTSSLKTKIAIEIIDRLLEEGQKVVIMDYFKDSLHELKLHYKEIAGLHTGDISVEDRAVIVADFQNPNGSIKVFLGSIQTCNYGLTLTAASNIFILTLPYSVGEFDQAIDRLHRIGQKDVVNAYAFIFRNTIDEYVFKAIEGKRKEINRVIDNEHYESDVTESVMGEVMNKIKEKYATQSK